MSDCVDTLVPCPIWITLPRSIRHAWRQAADAFCGGHDPTTVAERAPLEPALVGTASYPTHRNVSDAVTVVLACLQVVPLARVLAAAELGKCVRAPRSLTPRKSTKELLNASI